MIKMVPSLVDALAVANKLINDERLEGHTAYIESYQNGREQGILIWAINLEFNKALYIAHHRNSDALVVYEGEYSMQSISEDAYKNCKWCDTIEECVEYAVERITEISRG